MFRSGALEFEVLIYINYNLSELRWFCLLCLIDILYGFLVNRWIRSGKGALRFI